jgi:hypothetical protein
MTMTHVLIPDLVQLSPTDPVCFAADTSATTAEDPEIGSGGGWDAQITTGDGKEPGTVIDRAQFDSMDEAKRWTATATLYWQAHAPDGWWVTGGITATADQEYLG